MTCPHQDGLVAQQPPLSRGGQHRVGNGAGLGGCVVATHQLGPPTAVALRVQRQRMGRTVGQQCSGPHGIREIQQALPRPEIPFQPNHRHVVEGRGQSDQVVAVRAPEPVDGLRVVADHRQAPARGPQAQHDVDLRLIHILVLVDQHVIPPAGDLRTEDRIGQQTAPGQQQIVEVEHSSGPLTGYVGPEQLGDGRRMWLQPRKIGGDQRPRRGAGAHRPGVQVDQRRRIGHPRVLVGQAVIMPEQIHRVGRIGPVQHRHLLRQSQHFGVPRNQLVRNGMEGAALQAARRLLPGAHGRGPAEHVVSGTTGEGEQQDPLGRDTTIDQVRHPRRQRPGLSGAGARQDDQRRVAVGGRRQLGVIQPGVPTSVEHTSEHSAARAEPGAPRPQFAAGIPAPHHPRATGTGPVTGRAADLPGLAPRP